MLFPTLFLLALQGLSPDTAPGGIWSLPNGVYAERHEDGTRSTDTVKP